MKAIAGEFQHALAVAELDKRKIRKVVRKTCIERRKISLLKDVKIRKRSEEKVIKLVEDEMPNLWVHFKERILKARDEMCGKKRGKAKGDTWRWNEEVKEAVPRKKDAHKARCQSRTEENKRRGKSIKNKAKKAVSKAMREKAEEALTELQNCSNGMLRPVKGRKHDSKEVAGGGRMRGSDGMPCFSEKVRDKVSKNYMERTMNEENDWDQNVEGDAEGPVVCGRREEVLQALNKTKTGKSPGP